MPYEIIIGDDSQGNKSKLIVENINRNKSQNVIIRYFQNQPSLGQLANVNSLIEKTEGNKFMLLHDDDLLFPDALETLVNLNESDPSIQVSYGKQMLINDAGEDLNIDGFNERFFRTKDYEGTVLSPIEAAIVQQFPNNGYLIDTYIAKKTKYSSKEKVGNAGDFNFGLQLGLSNYKFYYIDHYIAKYRISKNSVARNGTDSAYQSYKLIKALDLPAKDFDYRNHVLKIKAPIAIVQAIRIGKRRDAFKIYFEQWHKGKILTLGGIRRLLLLLFSRSRE
ncbi:Glycosyltransferase, GT2 family [Parapedobacter koreensis]|uniref:Glycosyltransferase, GT2 family n=1 Tax=Parapedobacter koreensis TaxID=332977 RepID=A0A1H7NNH6_9SPHI|nr:Glycosyltransferase, GT2 family [Parapedobacter koreensis]